MASSRAYYRLTKPGIVYGNAIHFVAGVLLAASMAWSWTAALGGLIGLMCIVASACVVNNYIDRDIDSHMKRTQKRPSVTGLIGPAAGIAYALALLAIGFLFLVLMTNTLTVLLGVAAYILYTFVYTLSKRRTVHHTLIGTVPGALPVVAGYTSLTNQIDLAVFSLFMLVLVWQLGHFYAIGIYRKGEYRSAGVPMLTQNMSKHALRRLIIASILLYIAAAVMMSYITLSTVAAILLIIAAIWWLFAALERKGSVEDWARGVFRRSLLLSLLLPLIMAVELAVVRFF